MDLDWCIRCDKHTKGGLYCSEACRLDDVAENARASRTFDFLNTPERPASVNGRFVNTSAAGARAMDAEYRHGTGIAIAGSNGRQRGITFTDGLATPSSSPEYLAQQQRQQQLPALPTLCRLSRAIPATTATTAAQPTAVVAQLGQWRKSSANTTLASSLPGRDRLTTATRQRHTPEDDGDSQYRPSKLHRTSYYHQYAAAAAPSDMTGALPTGYLPAL